MMWLIFALCALILNLIFVCIMVLFERKKPEFIPFWLLLFVLLPVIGFFVYLIVGTSLRRKIRKQIERKKISDRYLDIYCTDDCGISDKYQNFVEFLNFYGAGNFTFNKSIDFFSSSHDKIKALKKDIQNAQHSINLEYYIFKNDKIGREIMFLLCEKARQGVEVNLVYDAVGSLSTKRSFFKKLDKFGGKTASFFPSALKIKYINTKLNFRNHRKIVVIDGKIAYFGGMNICLDEVKNKQIRPWRDLHVRIEGETASVFQAVFLSDFRYATNDTSTVKSYLTNKSYFPDFDDSEKKNAISVVVSGPDKRLQSIKEVMIKLISMAKKSIFIQTPYFVLDDTFITALRIASFSGVKIKIMLPYKPDRKMMQQMGFSYANQLMDFNVEFYLYDGFMHSKLILIDDEIAILGSCNMDNRSFSLNFESNAIFYDKENIISLKKIVENDLKNSFKATKKILKKGMPKTKFGRAFLKLLSPLL